jgi:hypothetical protein
MPLNLYKIQLRSFEKKYHNLLVDMFIYMRNIWNTYNTKYNDKSDMDYTDFVKYCYSVSNTRPKMY